MLKIHIDDKEYWDEKNQSFIYVEQKDYYLEHSLRAIAKWEEATEKPFLITKGEHTPEDMVLYYKCMVDDDSFDPMYLNEAQVVDIVNYMQRPHTATTIRTAKKQLKSSSVMTSEVIYAVMVETGIPFECQDWHINRLLMLLNVLDLRANPKKMSRNEIYKQNTDLNEQRKARYNTKG